MPTLKYKNGTTWTTVPANINAGFAAPTATINNATGTPSCTVTYSGDNSARKYNFAFTNVKGSAGATGGTGAQGNSGNSLGYVIRRLTSDFTLPYLVSASNANSMAISYNAATTLTGDGTLTSVTKGVRLSGYGFVGISCCAGFYKMNEGNTSVYAYIGEYAGTSFPSSWSGVNTHQGKDQVMMEQQQQVAFPEGIFYFQNTNTIMSLLTKCYQVSGTAARAYATNFYVVKYA